MGKFTKKLKKFAKKAAPLAMLGLGAAALAKRRKTNALNAITDYGDTGPLSGKIGYEGDIPSAPVVPRTRKGSVLASPKWQGHDFGLGPFDGAKKGGRAGKDFGKRGAGCAKRGFGRALKKK